MELKDKIEELTNDKVWACLWACLLDKVRRVIDNRVCDQVSDHVYSKVSDSVSNFNLTLDFLDDLRNMKRG